MNNNFSNGNKLLYVTVFVAALMVATISGTLAYFQASASNNSISGNIVDTNITLSVEKMTPNTAASNGTYLIPFDLITVGTEGESDLFNSSFLTNNTTGAFYKGCVDDFGYTACDVFKIKVSAPNPLDIDGYLKIGPVATTSGQTTTYSDITNLKWMLIGPRTNTSVAKINNISSSVYNTANYLVIDNVKGPLSFAEYTAEQNPNLGDKFTTIAANDYKISSTDSYYYILVWLEDINNFQTDTGAYQGTVTFTAKDDIEGRVTARFGSS